MDLKLYKDEITDAVHQIMANAQVVVERDYCIVYPTPAKSDAIRIGRLLSNGGVMAEHCIKVSKLFCSEKVKNRNVLQALSSLSFLRMICGIGIPCRFFTS